MKMHGDHGSIKMTRERKQLVLIFSTVQALHGIRTSFPFVPNPTINVQTVVVLVVLLLRARPILLFELLSKD